jgi:hypothetical protein
MKFRLGTIAYAFALLAAGMAAFGNWGILAAAAAGVFWFRAASRRWGSVKVRAVVMTLLLLLAAAFGGALSAAREAAQQSCCHGRLFQLAHVLNSFGNNVSYPAAVTRDGGGKPLHSWRTVAMQQAGWLNSQSTVDFAQPWNSVVNQAALGGENEACRCPSCLDGSSKTDYFAVIGEQTAWPADRGRPIVEITDDPDSTILLVESWRKDAAWAAPVDLSFDEAVDLLSKPPLPGTGHETDRGYFYLPGQRIGVTFVSGRYASLRLPLRRELAVALLTVDGGERIDEEEWQESMEPALDYQAIYGLTAFVALALGPSVRWRRA